MPAFIGKAQECSVSVSMTSHTINKHCTMHLFLYTPMTSSGIVLRMRISASSCFAGKLKEMAGITSCPLFTENHGQHSSVWSVPGFSLPVLCVACLVERLERKGELSVHMKKVLGEVQGLLAEGSQSRLLSVLKSDKRVLEKLCGHLFGMYF